MSVNQFPITAAQLSGNFCETLFYGMYLVTCCICARTLLITGSGQEERWLRLHEIRWIMASVAIALFIVCTFDVAIGLLHNFHAFIRAKDPTVELNNIADWINIARSVNQVVAMILGDFVLIYRCWVVHGRRWLVIIPSLFLYLGAIAVAIKLIEVEASPATVRTITLNSSQIRPWYSALFAINAVQNILTTSILIWRIWRVERDSEKYINYTGSTINQPRHLLKVIRVIAESGAAYTLTVVVTFLVSISKSNALYPASDMTLQATGIAFNVILVRSSARRDRQFTMYDHNERTTIMFQHTTRDMVGDTTLGTVNTAPSRENRLPHDLESGAKGTDTMDKPLQSDVQLGGIMVTKSVVKS